MFQLFAAAREAMYRGIDIRVFLEKLRADTMRHYQRKVRRDRWKSRNKYSGADLCQIRGVKGVGSRRRRERFEQLQAAA